MTAQAEHRRTTNKDVIQTVATVVGATFLVVGVAAFIPGITTHLYGGLHFAGHDGNAALLGIFDVSILHNLVHLAFGVFGLMLARTAAGSRNFLVGGGAIYLVLWIYGLLIDKQSGANFVPLDSADNWLHFALGAGMLTLGLILGRKAATAPSGRPVAASRS